MKTIKITVTKHGYTSNFYTATLVSPKGLFRQGLAPTPLQSLSQLFNSLEINRDFEDETIAGLTLDYSEEEKIKVKEEAAKKQKAEKEAKLKEVERRRRREAELLAEAEEIAKRLKAEEPKPKAKKKAK